MNTNSFNIGDAVIFGQNILGVIKSIGFVIRRNSVGGMVRIHYDGEDIVGHTDYERIGYNDQVNAEEYYATELRTTKYIMRDSIGSPDPGTEITKIVRKAGVRFEWSEPTIEMKAIRKNICYVIAGRCDNSDTYDFVNNVRNGTISNVEIYRGIEESTINFLIE